MTKLDRNHLHYFVYAEPITRGLRFWDRWPLIVILDNSNPRSILGLNLHHITQRAQKNVVEWILDNSRRSPPKQLVKIVYRMLTSGDPRLSGGVQGVRRYIRSRMKRVQRIDKRELQKFDTPRKVRLSLFRKYKRNFVGPDAKEHRGKVKAKR